jgi:hypothetical protein
VAREAIGPSVASGVESVATGRPGVSGRHEVTGRRAAIARHAVTGRMGARGRSGEDVSSVPMDRGAATGLPVRVATPPDG